MEQNLEEHASRMHEAAILGTDKSPTPQRTADILAFTSQIVASYVKGHIVPMEKIHDLVQVVFSALSHLHHIHNEPKIFTRTKQKTSPVTPAVPIKKSITDDYIICLEDGKKFKMLKRYLRTRYNMTPEQYRQKWQLPPTYPMVARNYSKRRSLLARHSRLGKGRSKGNENG